jgi:hypothetical protein
MASIFIYVYLLVYQKQFSMKAKEWLEENEWENRPIESDAFSHYTMLDTLMEQYAKHYMSETLKDISNKTKTKINKFI